MSLRERFFRNIARQTPVDRSLVDQYLRDEVAIFRARRSRMVRSGAIQRRRRQQAAIRRLLDG